MGFAGFLGCALIAGGPGLAIFCTILARKSFLVLLVLACAFVWLVGLLLTSLILRGLLPLDGFGAQTAALVVAVAIQEGIRYGCYLMHRRLVLVLNSIADKMEGAHRLTTEDEGLLALAQGWAHATTHSIFFYYSWLPLYLGDATLYLDACPHMSFFLAGALLTLVVNLLHTFSMPLAFSGWTQGLKRRWIAVPVAHLVAALLTLANLRRNGCLGSIPVILLLGLAAGAWAGAACWGDALHSALVTHAPLSPDEEPDMHDHHMNGDDDH
ncbi:hypothetical protein CVIRNUC_004949 [Coccomyxa viridis]|uniref:Uncharacterized protein n=1 Tax=Coccomyxa viridis TaxID=1274662 RepID=A0AAV1I348_9CHLO|nr:hypothetical protein CVIRNUC_004949 [Coccomyxa viridis]